MVAYTASHPRTLGQQRALLTEVFFIIKEEDLFKLLLAQLKLNNEHVSPFGFVNKLNLQAVIKTTCNL